MNDFNNGNNKDKIMSFDLMLEIMKRHINEYVSVVYKEDDGIFVQSGELLFVKPKGIIIKESYLKYGDSALIPFKRLGEKIILNVHNSLEVDIFNTKATPPLSAKVKFNFVQKNIIENLKAHLKDEIFVIHKKEAKLTATKGRFGNLGVKELTLIPAPSYLTYQTIPIELIYHIYLKNGYDLIKEDIVRLDKPEKKLDLIY